MEARIAKSIDEISFYEKKINCYVKNAMREPEYKGLKEVSRTRQTMLGDKHEK